MHTRNTGRKPFLPRGVGNSLDLWRAAFRSLGKEFPAHIYRKFLFVSPRERFENVRVLYVARTSGNAVLSSFFRWKKKEVKTFWKKTKKRVCVWKSLKNANSSSSWVHIKRAVFVIVIRRLCERTEIYLFSLIPVEHTLIRQFFFFFNNNFYTRFPIDRCWWTFFFLPRRTV